MFRLITFRQLQKLPRYWPAFKFSASPCFIPSRSWTHVAGQSSTTLQSLEHLVHQVLEGQNGLRTGQEVLTAGQEALTAGQEALTAGQEVLTTNLEVLTASHKDLKASQEVLTASVEVLTAGQEVLTASVEVLTAGQEVLTTNLEVLTASHKDLKAGQEVLTAEVNRLSFQNGSLSEMVARGLVEKQFGQAFAKMLLVRNIGDYLKLFDMAPPADVEEQVNVVRRIGSRLMKEKILLQYVAALEKVVATSDRADFAPLRRFLPWIQNGALTASFAQSISSAPPVLKPKLVRLNLTASKPETIIKCEGAGVMLSVFAANPTMDPIAVPEELEMDFRGSISFVANHLQVSVGEFKTSLAALPDAKRQLTLRANTYVWVGEAVMNKKDDADFNVASKMVIGRIFSCDRSSRRAVDEVHGEVSFYVHVL
ncbi:UNVERIFIED_CONTAM: hypothetical protein HDU68_000473 [Siphonaria sp. JEL0065]|nr:hypothetical protein HDU68_000473 [Siphonaria sp. JEL0065]